MSECAAASDGLPAPRRHWAAAAIWLALAMAVLDSSIANIALPTIGRDLGASPSGSIWVVNAYQIAITLTLLPMAALAENIGYARIYTFGLALFVGASFGCVAADSLTTLTIARFIQGLGAGCVFAINGALVRFTYPLALLGRGLGYNALVVAVSSAAGPSVAAGVLAIASWRWLFAVNLPIGLLAFAIAVRSLPRTLPIPGRFDAVSALFNVAAFGALFLAGSDLAHGAVSPRTAGEAVVAFLAGTALVRRARGQARPMVPLDLLRIPILRLSYATSSCSFAAQMIGLVSLPFYLRAGSASTT